TTGTDLLDRSEVTDKLGFRRSRGWNIPTLNIVELHTSDLPICLFPRPNNRGLARLRFTNGYRIASPNFHRFLNNESQTAAADVQGPSHDFVAWYRRSQA